VFVECLNGPHARPSFANVAQRRAVATGIVGTVGGNAKEISRVLARLRGLSVHVRRQLERILVRDLTTRTRHSKYVVEIEAIAAAATMAAQKG
jgi:uncharacterized membrane protein